MVRAPGAFAADVVIRVAFLVQGSFRFHSDCACKIIDTMNLLHGYSSYFKLRCSGVLHN